MEPLFDYKKFAILYVDDEEKSLKYFQRAFGGKFRVFVASNAKDGYHILEERKDEIGILLTDQRMPGEKGVELLGKAKALKPDIIRILVTAYSDFDAAIDAVNKGMIYKYISKPWDVADLEITLRRALEYFMMHFERNQLMRQKFTALHKTLILDRVVGLTVLASGITHVYRNSVEAVRSFMEIDSMNPSTDDLQISELNNPNLYRKLYMQTREQIRRVIDLLQLEEMSTAGDSGVEGLSDVQADAVLQKVLDSYRTQFEQKCIDVRLDIGRCPRSMTSEPMRFEKLQNLIVQNLLLYVPEHSPVHITLEPGGDEPSDTQLLIRMEEGADKTPISGTRAILDPFFTSDALMHHLGLNLLAICLLTYHLGGTMSYKSMEGTIRNRLDISIPLRLVRGPASPTELVALEKALINEALWETVISQMED
jgi:two-component system, probable response regulator PhcQ